MGTISRRRTTREAAYARGVVARNLIDARLSSGLSQREAGRRFSGNRATLSRIEGGIVEPTVCELVDLAGLYYVPFSRLVEGI